MPLDAGSSWERRFDVAYVVLPYVLLTATAVASLAQPHQTALVRLQTLGLVLACGLWVFLLHTRRPGLRRRGGPLAVLYLAGLLALGAVGMLHDPLFFIFTTTAFAHCGILRRIPAVFAGVGATALVINTFPYRIPDPTDAQLLAWAAAVVVQTVLLGITNLLGRLLSDENDQRRRMVQELETTLAENAGLHAQLVTQAREAGVHDERQRMAREIHDTLTQGLAGIITQLEAASHTGVATENWRGHLATALTLARQSLDEARRSVHALHPEPLEAAQLPEVLDTLLRRWAEGTGVSVGFHLTGEAIRIVPDVEAALFRVVQEALTNIGKHARATRVDMTLSYTGEVVLLDIRDDGSGFEVARLRSGPAAGRPAGHGYGLGVMRQRVQRVAGTLEVESRPGEGTVIAASVPAIPADAGTARSLAAELVP